MLRKFYDSFQAAETQLTDLTDNLGSFKLEDLEDRLYELTATKGEDFYPASSRVKAGMANAELILQGFRIVRVFGQITDETEAPLDAVKVRSLGSNFVAFSDENGGY